MFQISVRDRIIGDWTHREFGKIAAAALGGVGAD